MILVISSKLVDGSVDHIHQLKTENQSPAGGLRSRVRRHCNALINSDSLRPVKEVPSCQDGEDRECILVTEAVQAIRKILDQLQAAKRFGVRKAPQRLAGTLCNSLWVPVEKTRRKSPPSIPKLPRENEGQTYRRQLPLSLGRSPLSLLDCLRSFSLSGHCLTRVIQLSMRRNQRDHDSSEGDDCRGPACRLCGPKLWDAYDSHGERRAGTKRDNSQTQDSVTQPACSFHLAPPFSLLEPILP